MNVIFILIRGYWDVASTKYIGDYAFKAGGVKGWGTSAEVSITFSPILPLKILLYISNTYMLP